MRQPHIVQRVGNRPWPQYVVCVQAACKQKYLSEGDDVGHLDMDAWAAIFGTLIGGNKDNKIIRTGTLRNRFWTALRSYTGEYKHVYIVSQSAREVAAALGLWDRIAKGRLTLVGADPWYREDDSAGGTIRKDGYVILAGPPTVICFCDPNIDTTYTWIDPANFGCGDLRPLLSDMTEVMEGRRVWDGEVWLSPDTVDLQAMATSLWTFDYYAMIGYLDLGGPGHTAASLAADGYRHKYMDHDIHIHDSEQSLSLERYSLVGGRCEARYIGTVHQGGGPTGVIASTPDTKASKYDFGPIYHYDVNSLYPSVAMVNALPTNLRAYCRFVSPSVAIAACKTCAVVARCDVQVDRPCVPYHHAGITIWPVGEFRTVLCGPEILLADQVGALLRVVELAVYDKRLIYDKWVWDLYALKCHLAADGNPTAARMVKALLNASFGKWAQMSRRWVDDQSILPIAPYTQWYGERMPNGQREQLRALGWRTQRLRVVGETGESFPAITAYINSLGRVRLWNLLETAGVGNVVYYDTDSIWCNQAGSDALEAAGEISQGDLGKLKLVGTHFKLRILGRQAYEVDGRLVLSGYCDKVVRTNDSFALAVKAPPIQHYLLKHEAPGMDRIQAKIRTTRAYLHGHVQEDGTVLPIRIND